MLSRNMAAARPRGRHDAASTAGRECQQHVCAATVPKAIVQTIRPQHVCAVRVRWHAIAAETIKDCLRGRQGSEHVHRMSDVRARGAQGVAAPLEMRDRLAEMMRDIGEAATARRLRINRQTLVRVVGGMPVRTGTLAQVADAMREAP